MATEEARTTEEVEEKVEQATENVEKEVENTISKELYDKKVSELNAKLKKAQRELNERLSEEEKKAQEQANLLEELNELRTSKKRAEFVSGISNVGISNDNIQALTEAVLSGDTNEIASAIANCVSNMQTAFDKELETLKLSKAPRPNENGTAKTENVMTKEKFQKLGLKEMQDLYNRDPKLFEQLSKK